MKTPYTMTVYPLDIKNLVGVKIVLREGGYLLLSSDKDGYPSTDEPVVIEYFDENESLVDAWEIDLKPAPLELQAPIAQLVSATDS